MLAPAGKGPKLNPCPNLLIAVLAMGCDDPCFVDIFILHRDRLV